jgi:hypothetical protein
MDKTGETFTYQKGARQEQAGETRDEFAHQADQSLQ